MNKKIYYPRTAHLRSTPIHNATSIIKEDEDLIGMDVVVTEKIDGINVQIGRNHLYARTCQAMIDVTKCPEKQWERLLNIYEKIRKNLDEKTILFCEYCFVKRDVKYMYDKIEDIYLFGSLNTETQEWASYEDLLLTDLTVAPLIFKGIVTSLEQINEWKMHQSELTEEFPEGFVVRKSGAFQFSEIQANQFKWVRGFDRRYQDLKPLLFTKPSFDHNGKQLTRACPLYRNMKRCSNCRHLVIIYERDVLRKCLKCKKKMVS